MRYSATPLDAAHPFSLLVKPTSADCNLRCRYCFYLEKSMLYPDTPTHRMSAAVLERLVSSYMATEQPVYSFAWQGGEPTLMGLEFFREVIRIERKNGRSGSAIANSLQTNAVLVDDDFARYLARHRFLVGVSLDGPRDLHDEARRTRGGDGTHELAMRGVAALKRNGAEINVLTAVHASHRGRGGDVYRWLVESGFGYQQYIPIVEFDRDGLPLPYSIRPEDWGEFLCQVFDQWIRGDTARVSVRLFDSVLARMVNGVATICTMGSDCRGYYLVEHNGDIYPCDFFAEPGWRLGNVGETEWSDLQRSAARRKFGAAKSALDPACARCRFLELCAGDCPRNRRRGPDGKPRRSWLCAGWQIFYEHALPELQRLAGRLRSSRSA
jgi:uncharacterized protein